MRKSERLPSLRVPMNQGTIERLKSIAEQMPPGTSAADLVRAAIAEKYPALADELNAINWGGSRKRT